MGSKKRRNRQREADAPVAGPPARPRWPLAVAVAVVAVAVVWALAGRGRAPVSAPPAGAPVETTAMAPVPAEPLPAHVPADDELPPLPFVGFQPPRPPDVVRAVYHFAAQHPEVMRYVPCYCGCEHSGHRDNEDCFVSARSADGQVTWNTHGMG